MSRDTPRLSRDTPRLILSDDAELRRRVGLKQAQGPDVQAAARAFPVRVPLSYLRRLPRGVASDPLLLQVLPRAEEQQESPGYGPDPLAEAKASPHPGLLHKYHGRVLLVTTGACAIHCRYCFRRHFPYAGQTLTGPRLRRVLDYLRARPEISEVILSGGDPLILSAARLERLVWALAAIPHLRRLRVHSRVPVAAPERAGEAVAAALSATRLPLVLVIHSNHPRELEGSKVSDVLEGFRRRGAILLNQAVLLAAVNDAAETLETLSERLFDLGVLPYYLHQLDRVAGAAHFAVPDRRARELVRQLRCRLPGYLVPRLVRESSGTPYKLPLL